MKEIFIFGLKLFVCLVCAIWLLSLQGCAASIEADDKRMAVAAKQCDPDNTEPLTYSEWRQLRDSDLLVIVCAYPSTEE